MSEFKKELAAWLVMAGMPPLSSIACPGSAITLSRHSIDVDQVSELGGYE